MIKQLCLCVMISLLAASCASDTTSKDQATTTVGTAKPGSTNSNNSDMPVPPKDAQYTLFCQKISGADHYDQSRALRQGLRDGTTMKDWYIVHSNDYSTLYYGFYRTIDPRDPQDGKEGARAIHDLDTIRQMTDANGFRPFSVALPVLISSPDPSAEPAWDLAHSGGYWSLQIAAYKGSPDRKQAAVDAVRAARAQGIEAYYYHGSTVSSVCIGSWPKDAAREIDPADQNQDPDKPIVVTPKPLSPAAQQQYDRNGIQTAAPTVEILDPTILATMRQYPQHSVNGEVFPKKPEPSFLVKVPQGDVDDGNEIAPVGEGGAPAAAVRQPTQDDQPGMGHLKSIGD
jgi:hypothetical protein